MTKVRAHYRKMNGKRVKVRSYKKKNRPIKRVKDYLPGGYGDGRPDSDFNRNQLRAGIKVEMEHTDSPLIAKEIAKDHLTEHKDYYKARRKMELALKRKRR